VVGGSYIALSHGIHATDLTDEQEKVRDLYRHTPTPVITRTPAEVAGMVAGLDLVEPGIVPVTDWHPDPGSDEEPQPAILAAVGRTP
jgi:hypothetical protein